MGQKVSNRPCSGWKKSKGGNRINEKEKEIEHQTGIGIVFFSHLLNEWNRFDGKSSAHKEYERNANEVDRQEGKKGECFRN